MTYTGALTQAFCAYYTRSFDKYAYILIETIIKIFFRSFDLEINMYNIMLLFT
jgi:hypothetical protein